MKTLKKLITPYLTRGTAYATLVDIKGRKSGGVRDGNKVDWKTTTGSSS
jgi:hypothetical protein